MDPPSQLNVQPIEASPSLRDKIYRSLKDAISSMNIYASDAELRLDERKLSDQLGISRTPLREALARLEQEGLITIVPRRGVFIVRKSRQEILEMITVWAALESMAARLVTQRAGDDEIASLRAIFSDFTDGGGVVARIDEYSERNIEFHQKILELSRCTLLREMADGLFLHMRGIRTRTIADDDRAKRSIVDHMHIIEAIEARETDLAERLVREHALNLGSHVREHAEYLEDGSSPTAS
jgi:DNA-binding GntR family transcriptional regulator